MQPLIYCEEDRFLIAMLVLFALSLYAEKLHWKKRFTAQEKWMDEHAKWFTEQGQDHK